VDQGEYESDDGNDGNLGSDGLGDTAASRPAHDAQQCFRWPRRMDAATVPNIHKGDGLDIKLKVSSENLTSVEVQKGQLSGSIKSSTETYTEVRVFLVSNTETKGIQSYVFKILVEKSPMHMSAHDLWEMHFSTTHTEVKCLAPVRSAALGQRQ
jgi:hypothetical protein